MRGTCSPPRGALPRKNPRLQPAPAAIEVPISEAAEHLAIRSRTHAHKSFAVAAAAARRDYGVLLRRVGTTVRRQTRHNPAHFVFWCLVMADVPPPKRARTAAPSPPSVTPADVAPEAQSDLAAFLARPAAARAPSKAKSPGPLPQASPPRRRVLWNGAGRAAAGRRVSVAPRPRPHLPRHA